MFREYIYWKPPYVIPGGGGRVLKEEREKEGNVKEKRGKR
jgi:hypothetical protein